MFTAAKLATLLSLSLAALAVPAPGGSGSVSQCNTGPVQCCQSVQSSGDPGVTSLLGLLGIVLDGANVPIGLTCSPINVLGLGQGASCDANPVCCEDNSNSLVSVGCVPVNLVG